MRKGEDLNYSYSIMACILLAALTLMAPSLSETPATVNKGTISGYIYDANTKQPLSQAFVYCQEVNCQKTSTDKTGYFAIRDCFSPSETYKIKCSKYGYVSDQGIIIVDARGNAVIDLFLKQAGSSPKENLIANVLPPVHVKDSKFYLTGTVFNDLNANGVEEQNEVGLSGLTINLEQNETVVNSVATDAYGKYIFGNLASGEYTVSEVLPMGYVLIKPVDGEFTVILSDKDITDLDFANFGVPPPLD